MEPSSEGLQGFFETVLSHLDEKQRRVVAEWNKFRLFSFISMNWRGRPLTDIRAIVEVIAASKAKTGLTVQAAYDPNWDRTRKKITDADNATIALAPHDWHGEWNFDIASPTP